MKEEKETFRFISKFFIQLWRYNEGDVHSVGIGHGSEVKKVKICPNTQHIISVGADGSIFRWKFPKTAV